MLVANSGSSLLGLVQTQQQQVADLTKTVGRGVPALADTAGNIIGLNPGSNSPLLTSTEHDVGLGFYNGVLFAVDASGQNAAPLHVGQINTLGNDIITSGGGIVAGTIYGTSVGGLAGNFDGNVSAVSFSGGPIDTANGYVNAGGGTLTAGTANLDTVHANGIICTGSVNAGRNTLTCGDIDGSSVLTNGHDINTQGGDLVCRNIVASGSIRDSFGDVRTPVSDRRLKTRIRPWEGDAVAVADTLPVSEFDWIDEDMAARAGRQVGFIAQELPDRFQQVTDDDGTLGYQQGQVLAVAVAAVQELSAQVAALTARLEALEAA